MPEVSAVIPAFQAQRTVAAAVESALGQVAEVIVVDDGSTDLTAEAAAAAGARVFRTANRGVAAARNFGIRQADREWLAFLDADDRWLPGAIERKLAVIESGLIGVFARGQFVGEDGRPLRRTPWGRAGKPSFTELLMEDTIPTSSLLLRRSVLESVGGFDESLTQGADHDLWLRLTLQYPGGLLGLDVIDAELTRHSGQVTKDVGKMLRAWSEILPKMEQLAPVQVAKVCAKAQANMRRVASMSAYEGGNSAEAASLLFEALRFAPAWMLRDMRTWKQLAAILLFRATSLRVR